MLSWLINAYQKMAYNMRDKPISNSRKAKFFKSFYNQRIIEGNKDVEDAIEKAAQKTKLNIQQAYELFDEVANRRWHGLRPTRDGPMMAYFKLNSKKLAEITEKMLCRDRELVI